MKGLYAERREGDVKKFDSLQTLDFSLITAGESELVKEGEVVVTLHIVDRLFVAREHRSEG